MCAYLWWILVGALSTLWAGGPRLMETAAQAKRKRVFRCSTCSKDIKGSNNYSRHLELHDEVALGYICHSSRSHSGHHHHQSGGHHWHHSGHRSGSTRGTSTAIHNTPTTPVPSRVAPGDGTTALRKSRGRKHAPPVNPSSRSPWHHLWERTRTRRGAPDARGNGVGARPGPAPPLLARRGNRWWEYLRERSRSRG